MTSTFLKKEKKKIEEIQLGISQPFKQFHTQGWGGRGSKPPNHK